MLKRLLTVVLVLMLVGDVSGIASAGDIKMDIDLDLSLDLAADLEDIDNNNILLIEQDGYRDKVGCVIQIHGGNLLVIDQTGCRTSVDFVLQHNVNHASGYNIATIVQDGYRNRVGAVVQWR